MRNQLATITRICRFNVGTELRQVFGTALRDAVNRDPERFDRLEILKETIGPLRAAARKVFANMGASGRVG